MKDILVIGDVMLDRTTTVRVRGTSPEDRTVLVAQRTDTTYGLGGAANVARNCVTLAADGGVTLFGAGRAGGSVRVDDLLVQACVSSVLAAAHHGYTPLKERIVTADGRYLLRLDEECEAFGMDDSFWANGGEIGDEIKADLFKGNDRLDDKPVICLVDYDKGFFTPAAVKYLMWLFNTVHESFDFPVIVDPGRTGLWARYSSTRTLFKANLAQVAKLHNAYDRKAPRWLDFDHDRPQDPATYERVLFEAARLLAANKIWCRGLVVTLGPGGIIASGREPGEGVVYAAGHPVPHADVCGAGDTVTAALAVCLAESEHRGQKIGSPAALAYAVREAAYAATEAVKRTGVYAVTREDMAWGPLAAVSPTTT